MRLSKSNLEPGKLVLVPVNENQSERNTVDAWVRSGANVLIMPEELRKECGLMSSSYVQVKVVMTRALQNNAFVFESFGIEWKSESFVPMRKEVGPTVVSECFLSRVIGSEGNKIKFPDEANSFFEHLDGLKLVVRKDESGFMVLVPSNKVVASDVVLGDVLVDSKSCLLDFSRVNIDSLTQNNGFNFDGRLGELLRQGEKLGSIAFFPGSKVNIYVYYAAVKDKSREVDKLLIR